MEHRASHEGKERYANVEFDLIDEDGNIIKEKGAYLIVDGGYHKWRCLICPYKFTSVTGETMWSEWIESVRKDVECTFGVTEFNYRCITVCYCV